MSVATTLTDDGLASPVAVLEGDRRKGSYGVPLPIAVIVDLDFVARSPVRHTRSGIGDALSNLSALAEGLLLSGIAMSVAGSSRPCSGACHEISHAIDSLFPGTGYHGERVAVGALFAGFLRGDRSLGQVDECFRRYGVPRVPKDLWLQTDQFAEAVAKAPSTRPDRYTILEYLDMDAAAVRARVDEFIKAFDR